MDPFTATGLSKKVSSSEWSSEEATLQIAAAIARLMTLRFKAERQKLLLATEKSVNLTEQANDLAEAITAAQQFLHEHQRQALVHQAHHALVEGDQLTAARLMEQADANNTVRLRLVP